MIMWAIFLTVCVFILDDYYFVLNWTRFLVWVNFPFRSQNCVCSVMFNIDMWVH